MINPQLGGLPWRLEPDSGDSGDSEGSASKKKSGPLSAGPQKKDGKGDVDAKGAGKFGKSLAKGAGGKAKNSKSDAGAKDSASGGKATYSLMARDASTAAAALRSVVKLLP